MGVRQCFVSGDHGGGEAMTATGFESAVYAIPADNRDDWVKVGAGINNTLGEAGKSLFMGWSATAPNFNQRDAEDVWKSFKPGRGITKGTIFGMAIEYGWTAPRPATGRTHPVMSQAARPVPPPAPTAPIFNHKAWERIQAVAQGVVPLDHPTAGPFRLYMGHRGLAAIMTDMPDPTALGFHPGLEYWQDRHLVGVFPAMVARVQRLAENTVTLHRTYLSPDGTKANVSEPKKIMTPIYQGATMGGAIRLYQAGDILGVAEGIENALAVRLATGMPVWATGTAGGMESLLLPTEIRTVHVWADLDRSGTGQRAAESLAQRMTLEGRTVRIHTPQGAILDGSKGIDWLDVWNAERGQP